VRIAEPRFLLLPVVTSRETPPSEGGCAVARHAAP
jgi:hypothetical protein